MGRAKAKGSSSFDEYVLSSIEDFHRFQIFAPTRVIKLESDLDVEDGDEHGVSYSMSSFFLKDMEILESMNHKPITVLFNTQGGDIIQGMAIYDRIKASPCHVTVKVYGCAMSMGSIILQAADDRVMAPNAALMFHDGNSYATGNNYETRNMANFLFDYGKRIDTILFDRINDKRDKDNLAHMSRRTFDDMSLKSQWMFAEKAVKEGLADRIEQPTIHTKGET